MDNGLYAFKDDTGFDRVVLDCITSLEHGADLLWIETERPTLSKSWPWSTPSAKYAQKPLVYNNSPSFNWTLKFREQVYVSGRQPKTVRLPRSRGKPKRTDAAIDGTELSDAADASVRTFQADAAREAGIFHH